MTNLNTNTHKGGNVPPNNSETSAASDSYVEVLETLCHRYAFGDVRALLPMLGLSDHHHRALDRLCLLGQRLIDMDAEDFAMTDVETGGIQYTALVERARACRMPQHPAEKYRGALDTLAPSYRLMLEVLAARHMRHDLAGLVATIHIMSEYLPLLVWENTWGHAGDPARIAVNVTGKNSLFGTNNTACPQRRADKNAAARALGISNSDLRGWHAYLDRNHSNVANALSVCAVKCRKPCDIITRYDHDTRQQLENRSQLAAAFTGSSIIKLRHAAPVGHGFGVPSLDEVARSWQHSRETIGKRGGLAESILEEDGYCLPGLPSFLSAITSENMTPDTLLKDTATLTAHVMNSAYQ